jgi:hypothetical protein
MNIGGESPFLKVVVLSAQEVKKKGVREDKGRG